MFGALLFSCRDTISIEGNISNAPLSDTVCYLRAFDFARNKFVVIDSSSIDQGYFYFDDLYWKNQLLRVSFGQDKHMNLFAEEEDIRIVGDYQNFDKAECLGTYAQEDAYRFDKVKLSYRQQFDSLGLLYQKFNEISDFKMRDSIQSIYDHTLKRYHEKILDFAAKYHTTIFSPFVIYINLYDLDKERVVDIYQSYPSRVKKSYFGQKLYKSILTVQKNRIGSKFTPFSAKTITGENFDLDQVQAKLVIINFWSSYCDPCLENMKLLREIYRNFQHKGLEIISISIDKREKYIDKIAYYDLPWIHICPLKKWESPLLKKYGIRYLPTNFVLDAEGTILAKQVDLTFVKSFFSQLQ